MMKKIFYIFIIFSMSFLSVYGQPPPPRDEKKPPVHVKKLGPDAFHFFRRAGIILSPEQTNRIYEISMQFVADEKPIREEIEKIDFEIKTELMKDNPNRNILRALIERKKEIEVEKDCLIMFRDLDIIAVLTPEQRVRLNQHRKK